MSFAFYKSQDYSINAIHQAGAYGHPRPVAPPVQSHSTLPAKSSTRVSGLELEVAWTRTRETRLRVARTKHRAESLGKQGVVKHMEAVTSSSKEFVEKRMQNRAGAGGGTGHASRGVSIKLGRKSI